MFKPRVRVKSGQRFGVVERINPDVNMEFWRCACGSCGQRLNTDGTIVCNGCERLFNGTWTTGRDSK